MDFDLVLLIQVSFLLFLPCLLIVAVWIGNRALLLLGDHLDRFQVTFAAIHDMQTKNNLLLVEVLRKVIVQGDRYR